MFLTRPGKFRYCFLCLMLLFSTRLHAQMPPPQNAGTPEKVGKAQATSGFVIDRSPMMTATIASGRDFDTVVKSANLNILGLSGPVTASNASTVSKSLKLFTDSTNYPPRDPPLPTRFPQRALLEQFRRYFWEQIAPSQQGSAALVPLVTKQPRTRLSSPNQTNKTRQDILDIEKQLDQPEQINRAVALLRDTVAFVAAQFVQQETRYRQEVFLLEQQSRWVGDRAYYNSTTFLYNNAPNRIEASAQEIAGDITGYGFGLKYDLIGIAPIPLASTMTLFERTRAGETSLDPKFGSSAERDTELQKIAAGPLREQNVRVARYVLSPHAVLAGDFRHLHDLGDFYGLTLNVSQIYPFRLHRNSSALVVGIGSRYNWFERSPGQPYEDTKGVGFSASIAIQENAPYLFHESVNHQDTENAELRRWHWRYGIEFSQRNAIVRGDYGALFGKWRDHGSGEYTLLAGSEANGQFFVGFNVSTYFAR